MESTIVVRCPGCGYDSNNPYFRYCGICGSALKDVQSAPPKPGPRPARAGASPSIAISSFSILGLQDDVVLNEHGEEPAIPDSQPNDLPYRRDSTYNLESTRGADYLLEEDDEPKPARWRLYVSTVLLVLCMAALAWEWQEKGSPWPFLAGLISSPQRPSPEPPPSLAAGPALAMSTPSAEPVTATPEPGPPSAAIDPQAPPSTTESQSPASNTALAPETAASNPAQPEPQRAAATVPPVPQPAVARDETETVPAANRAPAKAPNLKSVAANAPADTLLVPPSANAASLDANQLLVEGQKYLYGDGAVQDCGKALQYLRDSARTNSEAASLLGTMYASGHCVGRNLAPAYHWYARALHRDPTNTRFKSDLEVLWNQMTPGEKQAALRIPAY